ncbi:MAG: lipoyl synthase [Deltaproteobacteria bacterium]|nr:MAG: lipoyl synthase [Deltaproteobacteria bacterium]
MSAAVHKPKPVWLRRRLVLKSSANEVSALLRDLNLRTVCQGAHCPNQLECFGNETATFMILGEVCSRNCTFCAVPPGAHEPPQPDEPERVAEAVKRLGLHYVVITSVTRDDLADGGASHFAATIEAILSTRTDVLVEVLVPDFRGSHKGLATVLEAQPSVLNHNVETVSRLYPTVRPQANYQRSLRLLAEAKRLDPKIITKSGFMVGLGEKPEEVIALLEDLRRVGCDLVTIGQYLCPSKDHHPVVEYVHPERFDAYTQEAERLGFRGVAAGPYVRSSYKADNLYRKARGMD